MLLRAGKSPGVLAHASAIQMGETGGLTRDGACIRIGAHTRFTGCMVARRLFRLFATLRRPPLDNHVLEFLECSRRQGILIHRRDAYRGLVKIAQNLMG